MVKPHGFVLDFIGLFDKLEKALQFDSDEVNAIVKDLQLLKALFQTKMESDTPVYLALIQQSFDDRDVDILIEHFRDPDRRKHFFKLYTSIEMLFEIISPDKFLRPFLDSYATLTSMYRVVRKAYTNRVDVDRETLRKTEQLVRERVTSGNPSAPLQLVKINEETIGVIKGMSGGDGTKVINLIKSIERSSEEAGDPDLIRMADRARAVQEAFEARQTSTQEALDSLLSEIEQHNQRKREQVSTGFDNVTFFVYKSFELNGIPNPADLARRMRQAIQDHPNWSTSDEHLRQVRTAFWVTLSTEIHDMDRVKEIVSQILGMLLRSRKS